MAITAEEVRIIVDAETSKAIAGLKKTDTQTDKLIGTMKKLVGPAVLGLVAQKAIEIGKEFTQLAADAEETRSKFNTVFKSLADPVSDWANEYSEAVGRSSTDTLDFLATIQDTLVPLGFARDASADLSKQVVTLAGDLASFNNLPTADVVRDIQSAIVGNTETLRKYGVVASQVAIEQEAVNSGIWDGQGALTAQEKAAAILNLTIAGTSDAQGDLLRTQDSAANVAKRLESAQKDLGIVLGNMLNESLVPIKETFIDIIESQRDWLELIKQQKQDVDSINNSTGTLENQISAYGRALSELYEQEKDLILLGPESRKKWETDVENYKRNIAALQELLILSNKANEDSKQQANNAEIIARSQSILNTVNDKGNRILEERRAYLQDEINYFAQYRDLPGVQSVINTLVAKRNALDVANIAGIEKKNRLAKESQSITTETAIAEINTIKTTSIAWESFYTNLKALRDTDTASAMANASAIVNATQAAANAFGAALVAQESFWSATKEASKSAVSTILKTLGTQIAAEAAAHWAMALSPLGGASFIPAAAKLTAASAGIFASAAAVQGFANGGNFDGGLRVVGERGPELEATGPSRIYSARQTEKMLNGGGINFVINGVCTEETAVEIYRKLESAKQRGLY